MKYLLSLLAFGIVACTSAPKQVVQKPFLYEVKKGTSKGYIFGTIHTGVDVSELPDSFWPYFDKADRVIVEGFSPPEAIMASVNKYGYRSPEQKSLRELLSFEEYMALLAKVQKGHGVEVAKLSPFGAYNILLQIERYGGVQSQMKTQALTLEDSMDGNLYMRAINQNKSIVQLDEGHLETITACLATGHDQFYLNEIRRFLTKKTALQEELQFDEKAKAVYRESDEKALQDILSTPESMEFYACTTAERNKRWISQIESSLQSSSHTFVAVGTGHLTDGPASLEKLFTARGYTFQRVNLNTEK